MIAENRRTPVVIRVSATTAPSPATGGGAPAGNGREVLHEYRVEGLADDCCTIELDVPGVPALPLAVTGRAFTVRVICHPRGLPGSYEEAGQPLVLPITGESGSAS